MLFNIFTADNLLQLKSIQDQIQQLRVENAKQAGVDPSYSASAASRGGLMNLGMYMQQNFAARLSSSCPSLNNSQNRSGPMGTGPSVVPIAENNNYEGRGSFDMNSNYNAQSIGPPSNTPGHGHRRRKNNGLNSPVGASQTGGSLVVPAGKGHRKRQQGHHRQRRYSRLG